MSRNGADLLIETAETLGVTTCFANPGTTELHLVDALGRASSMRTVLTLFEGVASGACDGFARMAGVPAIGLFHLGPGYANSLANQHNARRHHTPMVNLIGDHATWHRAADAPLTSNIELLTSWTGATIAVETADEAGQAMADAFSFACSEGGRSVGIVLPADAAWSPTDRSPVTSVKLASPLVVDSSQIVEAAKALRQPGAFLIAGGTAITRDAQRHMAAIGRATGCEVRISRSARLDTGGGVPSIGELPYFPEPLYASLASAQVAVMVGITEPVTFFGYPEQASSSALPVNCERLFLGGADTVTSDTLAALAGELGVEDEVVAAEPNGDPAPPSGPLDARVIGAAFVGGITEGAIVVNESVTSGAGLRRHQANGPAHTMLSVLGGAIGGGLPNSVGAAVACPDRPVLTLQADGSAMYTIQSLWTMAREQLNVTVVICANRAYQILVSELERAGMAPEGKARPLVELSNPVIDFCSLASGFGVASEQVDSCESLVAAMGRGVSHQGPYLIEALMNH